MHHGDDLLVSQLEQDTGISADQLVERRGRQNRTGSCTTLSWFQRSIMIINVDRKDNVSDQNNTRALHCLPNSQCCGLYSYL